MADPCCAACGSKASEETEPFNCTECGRPLGICADCGWCLRLFAAKDAGDCDGCGWRPLDPEKSRELLVAYGPCPGCGGPRDRPERPCIGCSLGRQMDVQRQMEQRQGPDYEKARSRSRESHAAWRAAGSPAQLSRFFTFSSGEPRSHWYLAAPLKARGERIEATPEQVAAWGAWVWERERIRRNRQRSQ